ncbi:MAG: iron-sulfur cluster repair protein YtfE [Alphaproteobacteria bacterium]|nr:MAG: iron-sulfur cluster repair protein YtfE [Alphaproteobacteria bacterium]
MTLLETPIGTLAEQIPGATALFHRHGLQFCCGGSHSLEQAVNKAGVDLAEVLVDLSRLTCRDSEERDWKSEQVSGLISHILERFHKVHREQLQELVRLASRVEQVHHDKPACPLGLADHLRLMTVELESHMQKEEQVLFPMILRGQGMLAAGPVRIMMAEHEGHAEALSVIDGLTNGLTPPADACNSWRALYRSLGAFRADLERHIELENNILFLRALKGDEVNHG